MDTVQILRSLSSMVDRIPRGHIVCLAYLFWGHSKPLCALLSRIIQQKRVYVTLFTPLPILQKVKDEIEKCIVSKDHRDLIQSLAHTPFDLHLLHAGFRKSYKAILENKPLEREPGSEIYYKPVGNPQLVIVNFLGYNALRIVWSLSWVSIPIFAWNCGAAFAALMLYGPESLGGAGDLAAKLERLKIEDGETILDAADKIYRRTKGDVIQMPGLPEMYDYENIP